MGWKPIGTIRNGCVHSVNAPRGMHSVWPHAGEALRQDFIWREPRPRGLDYIYCVGFDHRMSCDLFWLYRLRGALLIEVWRSPNRAEFFET